MNVEISILIATRNRARALEDCLRALSTQFATGAAYEVIVVDDCSADHTSELVEHFVRNGLLSVHLIRQAEPRGANAARNRGLEAARGEIVVFVDDDVLTPPGWLEILIAGLHRSCRPVISGAVRLKAEGSLVGRHREEIRAYLGEILTPPANLNGEVVPVLGNMAAFRWVFAKARFDETVRPPVEEVDWLRRAGVKAAFLPEAWVWHCKTGDELRLTRVLGGVWRRGSEGGWWMRERLQMPWSERLRLVRCGVITSARAFAHAAIRRCWGGVIVGLGELSQAMAVVGIINRGHRQAESWR